MIDILSPEGDFEVKSAAAKTGQIEKQKWVKLRVLLQIPISGRAPTARRIRQLRRMAPWKTPCDSISH